MQIKFLGTGTSTGVPELACHCEVCSSNDPRDRRLRTSALFTIKGKNILIDCGPDFRQQMLCSHTEKIDAVLLTHVHYDHTSGLDELRVFCKEHSVDVFLEPWVADAIRARIPYCFVEHPYPGVASLNLNEIGTDPFCVQDISVIPIRVMHYKLPILGYRIEDVAYITDMLYISEEEMEKIKDVKILIINALRHTEHISHQTLDMALSLIKRVKPERAYLIHMSHHMGLHEVESKKLPENVYFAHDGLLIDTEYI